MEDICVKKSDRRNAYGQLAFRLLAEIARQNHIDTLCWSVMQSNDVAIRFYQKFNAEFVDKTNLDFTNARLNQDRHDPVSYTHLTLPTKA